MLHYFRVTKCYLMEGVVLFYGVILQICNAYLGCMGGRALRGFEIRLIRAGADSI